eukprot:Sdes_comp8921_c0_seq1m331
MKGGSVGFVYLPPALSLSAVGSVLSSLSHCSVILGDFNFRRGICNGDSISGPVARRDCVESLLFPLGFGYIENSSSVCFRVDHVFSRVPLVWAYRKNLPISSDGSRWDGFVSFSEFFGG